MNKITELGGIFIKAKDPKHLARWYEDNLGISFGTNVYFSFKWRKENDPSSFGRTEFSFMNESTDYFLPSEKEVMLNFRVNDLNETLKFLRAAKVNVIDKTESYEYGKFGWVLDPELNKIELWEPVDTGFGDTVDKMELRGLVTGIGGIFIKSKDPEKLFEWYKANFGFQFEHGAHLFHWKELDSRGISANTVFSFKKESTSYFHPSEKKFMINFRVNNLDKLLDQLRSSDANVIEKTETYDYGKFGWFVDPEGNKVELWEPTE